MFKGKRKDVNVKNVNIIVNLKKLYCFQSSSENFKNSYKTTTLAISHKSFEDFKRIYNMISIGPFSSRVGKCKDNKQHIWGIKSEMMLSLNCIHHFKKSVKKINSAFAANLNHH